MSTSSTRIAHLPSALLNWDSEGELNSKAHGRFSFYEMNEVLFCAFGIVLCIILGTTEHSLAYHSLGVNFFFAEPQLRKGDHTYLILSGIGINSFVEPQLRKAIIYTL